MLKKDPPGSMLYHALVYSGSKWPIFPCHSLTSDGLCTCRRPDCPSPGKHPIIAGGFKNATCDRPQIETWWKAYPYANIGLATGKGKMVIDIDPKNGGSLKALGDLPVTSKVCTGSGGYHLFFCYDPSKIMFNNSSGRLPPGIDVRADGGYVILPPSLHKSGRRYEWEIKIGFSLLPERLMEMIKAPRTPATEAASQVAFAEMGEGSGRNTKLTSIAGSLRRQGMDASEIETVLVKTNAAFKEPLMVEEVKRIAASVARYDPPAAKVGEKAGAKVAELHGKTLSSLMEQQIAAIRWAIPDLLPEGLVLIASKPKIGKSWFGLQAHLAIARGEEVFGRSTVPGKVLYLALEDSERRLQSRVQKLLPDQETPAGFYYETAWRNLALGGLEDLDAWLKTHPDTRLIGIDTMAMIRPMSGQKGSVYHEDYEFMVPLRDLANRHHVTILLTHHLRKADSSDPFDEVSGSTGLTGAVDATIVLKRDRAKKEGTLHITGRDVEEQELAILFDKDSCRWSIAGPVEEYSRKQEKEAILEAMREGLLTPKEIAEFLDRKQGSIGRTLLRMASAGEIVKASYGRYMLKDCQ